MQALRLRPDYADAALNLAAVEETLGSAGAAEMLYAHASKLRPLDPKAPTNRGLVLRKMGRLEEAEASYRRAIALAPNEARAHSALGNTLALQASLTRVVCSGATSPHCLPPCISRAPFSLQGRLEGAEASLREAIRLAPQNACAYNSLGVSLAQLGREDEAIRVYDAALKIEPTLRQAQQSLAELRSQRAAAAMSRIADSRLVA